ncbi:MAG TPA: S53 family peptidase [Candidatus Sulfotelmatobacter sp.]|nr:S53 family peptidase [Candidatus Sulfotelmatobacter sp.]
MATRSGMVRLKGSERDVLPGARAVGESNPSDRLTLSLYVRRNPRASPPSVEALGAQLPRDRRYLTHEQVEKAYGASPADLERVARFAATHGLVVVHRDAARRLVQVSGSVAAISAAFGVTLRQYERPGEHYRGREGFIHVPKNLKGVVEAVLGLDNRRVGRSYLRRARRRGEPPALAKNVHIPIDTYFPPQVAKLYDFPAGADGTGQTIGIVTLNESGGGYSVSALEKYFTHILKLRMPQITAVVVHGRGNDPHFGPSVSEDDVTDEVMLDLQVAGAAAPGAKLVMYFSEFTQQGWVDAITRFVHDREHHPSVVSISYGNPEKDGRSAWTDSAIRVVNAAFEAAAAKGITVCCASGDDGSHDDAGDRRAHADFPASSPYVLGCGGTRLVSRGQAIVRETVWNDSSGAGGGGVSALFPVPRWQKSASVPPSANRAHLPGRGVPDVSGLADPVTGYQVINADGSFDPRNPSGGTSATAPLWAALIARINEKLGVACGYLNPLLYTRFSSGVLRDIVHGSIGAYSAREGWDACTGLGSPGGTALLRALGGHQEGTPVHAGALTRPKRARRKR